MIRHLLDGRYRNIRLFHVRLAFSENMDSVGKASWRKVWLLFTTILRIGLARIRFRTPVLYYPPSGPNTVPVIRDIILLVSVRWLFARTVFHFHAGGVSGFAGQLPAVLRPFFRFAYRTPALAIRTAPQNPDDGAAFGAHRSVVVPNGLPDARGTVPERVARAGEPVIILFTGVLVPSKGVRILLEAFALVIGRGANAQLELMGKWGDEAFQQECEAFLTGEGITDRVTFLGVKQDLEKNTHFAACDIFCFPSHFEAESFGLVVVEAMQFAKPVVATAWRGIPSVVEEGRNGFLVPVRDPGAVADRLMALIADPGLRGRMGAEGRRIFEERFTLERFQRNMEEQLSTVLEARR